MPKLSSPHQKEGTHHAKAHEHPAFLPSRSVLFSKPRPNLGPMLKVLLLVSYIKNATKLKGAKGISDYQGFAKKL